MSSHHFVKEGQEPALLIVDAAGISRVEGVLEWAPLVIVMDKAIDKVLAWGIKADVVITGSNAANEVREKLMDQMPVKIISSSSTDYGLDTAFYFLISIKQHAVIIAVDDASSYFQQAEKFSDRLKITLLSDSVKWSAVPSGSFKKWLPANTGLIVRSQGVNVTSSGKFERTTDKVIILEDSVITLQNDGFFWVGEDV